MVSADGSAIRSRRGALIGLGIIGLACSSVLGIDRYGARAASVRRCDAAVTSACPPDEEGSAQTCFRAQTLGGHDFCVAACDPTQAPANPEEFSCLGTGALLRVCDPDVPHSCPDGLSCFRTEVARVNGLLYPKQPSGLCIDMPVCTEDADCAGEPIRRECGSAVVRSTYPSLAGALVLNDLQCVEPCEGSELTCASGEECLDSELFSALPSICVPACEDAPCPPNFYCLAHSGSGYPPLCVPGIPGGRCTNPEDCLLGYCVDTEAGFNLCSIDCDSDAVCQLLADIDPGFMCLMGHCVTKASYAGENCQDVSQCPAGKVCASYNPYDPSQPRDLKSLECRLPCDANGHCEPRGGMPYVCLPSGECYPGDMGLGCTSSDECMGQLTCECVEHCDEPAGGRTICTAPCETDAECRGYSQAKKICLDGWCQLPAQP